MVSRKINSIQYFLNSPYGADIDETSGNVEFTLSMKPKVLELREKTSKMPLNHYVNMAYVIKYI